MRVKSSIALGAILLFLFTVSLSPRVSHAEDEIAYRSRKAKASPQPSPYPPEVNPDDLATYNEQAEDTYDDPPESKDSRPRLGEPLPGLTPAELAMFHTGEATFQEVESVKGDEYYANSSFGLGPRYNSDSCVSCHSSPAAGGTSPLNNPLISVGSKLGAKNRIPPFILPYGPVREARFKYVVNANGTVSHKRDGGVYNLYTITGRPDAEGCYLKQPDFQRAIELGNVIYRIPTPLFGLGLIEAITDKAILDSHDASARARYRYGIEGHPNVSGNDGTITRFGWKAQNKSLMIFAGEAYNVEMGVTNELFPNKREKNPRCTFNPLPEDHTSYEATTVSESNSDVTKFTSFMRMLAPPAPAYDTPSIIRGRQVFNEVGCALCHTPQMVVGDYFIDAITRQKYAYLYSDLFLHRMGYRLADDIIQGSAGPDEFRTAPLWGLSQRIFYLHDGRTKSLSNAIELHYSRGNKQYAPSEANSVVEHWRQLSERDRQELQNFLRAL